MICGIFLFFPKLPAGILLSVPNGFFGVFRLFINRQCMIIYGGCSFPVQVQIDHFFDDVLQRPGNQSPLSGFSGIYLSFYGHDRSQQPCYFLISGADGRVFE